MIFEIAQSKKIVIVPKVISDYSGKKKKKKKNFCCKP